MLMVKMCIMKVSMDGGHINQASGLSTIFKTYDGHYLIIF